MIKERKDFLTLDEIMSSSPEKARMQVVFVDIVKYSKRDDKCQLKFIKSFTEEIKSILYSITEEYGKDNGIEPSIIHHNVIKIPTGDGIAIGFPYPKLLSIHLDFATKLQHSIFIKNQKNHCEVFNKLGYCKCHPLNYSVRIGVDEGDSILYKDINKQFNLAGDVINMSSRLLSKIKGRQIGFSERAYKELFQFDQTCKCDFKLVKNRLIKHNIKLNFYLFIKHKDFLDTSAMREKACK